MGKQETYRHTISIGKTKLKIRVPENNPVYEGVMRAASILGGQFPEHVGVITILPDKKLITDPKRRIISGNCHYLESGRSQIIIYAGSITRRNHRPEDATHHATVVTLHEIGHSKVFSQMSAGIWLDDELSTQTHETIVNKFMHRALFSPRNQVVLNLTWKDIKD